MQFHHKIKGRIQVDKGIREGRLIDGMPLAEERLDTIAQKREPRQIVRDGRAIDQGAKLVMEVEQAKDTPIESCIPDDLGDHDLSIIHEGILLFIDTQPDMSQTEKELVVDQCSTLDVLTIQKYANPIAGQSIADGNHV